MARIQIPVDALTSRFNITERFNNMRSGGLATRFSNLKPISEFFDYKRLSKPENFADAQSRVNYNLSYFSSNYAVVFVMLGIYALLTNWALLFDIIFVVGGLFIIGRLEGRDLEIGSFRATTSQLYTGLLCIAIPVGLWASPITTILWLIGASGVTILGHAAIMEKPIDEAFSGEAWGRPSRRGRRNGGREYRDWDPAARVVEEVDGSGEEDDGGEYDTEDAAQGAGLISRRSNRRIEGDPSRYPGIDTAGRGDGTAVRRGGYPFHSEEDDDDDEDDDSSEEDDDVPDVDLEGLSPMERDEILVQSAFRHIQRAQEKGRTDVRLTEEELAAMERRRKRMEEEAARKAARRRARSQRIAIPLSQLDAGPPRKKRVPSAQDLAALDEGDQVGYPPMGYFPPPRSRPRSGTTSSQRPGSSARNSRGSSPFSYNHAHQSSRPLTRQASDASPPRTRSQRAKAQAQDSESESSASSSSLPRVPGSLDPFKYQVSGPRLTRGATATISTSRGNPVAADVAYGGSARNAQAPVTRVSTRRRQISPADASSKDASEDSSESDSVEEVVVRPRERRTRTSAAAAAAAEEDRGRRKDKDRDKEEKSKKAQSPAAKTTGTGPLTRRKKKKK